MRIPVAHGICSRRKKEEEEEEARGERERERERERLVKLKKMVNS